MYAIIQARGRQLKVTPGAIVESRRHPGRARVASSRSTRCCSSRRTPATSSPARPFVANAKVVGVVDGEARGPKLRVFKKKRRKGFRKTRGHRSVFTRVRITDIQV